MKECRRVTHGVLLDSIAAMNLNHSRLFDMTANDFTQKMLRKTGLMPHLLAPEEKVKAEIIALRKATGFSTEQAIGYMASCANEMFTEAQNGSGPVLDGAPLARERVDPRAS